MELAGTTHDAPAREAPLAGATLRARDVLAPSASAAAGRPRLARAPEVVYNPAPFRSAAERS